jgi:cobalt/nickel transport protein
MRRLAQTLALLAFLALLPLPALAHFAMVIPDENIVTQESPKTVNFQFMFRHPTENNSLDLEKPKVELLLDGKKTDMTGQLAEFQIQGKKAWKTSLEVKKPGVYIVGMDAAPYWEKAEDQYIWHFSKTVVNALNADEGWDKPLGQKVEIIPLTRPYGLYAGNSFTGRAVYKNKPLADKNVEIQFVNTDGKLKVPAEAYVTQVVKTGHDGVFTYTVPWAGWWGFAALTDDADKKKHDGKDKNVEIGGEMWVYFHESLVK